MKKKKSTKYIFFYSESPKWISKPDVPNIIYNLRYQI